MYLLSCDRCLDGYVYINVDLYICFSVTDIRLLHVKINVDLYIYFSVKTLDGHMYVNVVLYNYLLFCDGQ